MSIRKQLRTRFPGGYRVVRREYYKWRWAFASLKNLMKNGSVMDRVYLVNRDKKLIYVANAKVASSSIKSSVYGLGKIETYHDVNHELSRAGALETNIGIDAYPDCYRFSFVRNPYRRLLSCYLNKYHTDKEESPEGRVNSYFLYYDTYLLGYLRKDKGFAHFARRVCRIPDRLADRHIVGQRYMLTDPKSGRRVAEFIGRMEDLPEAYEPIRERFDVSPLPHYNSTQAKKKSNWMDAYDLRTAQMVYRRYKDDIEAFGYQQESDELMAYLNEKEQSGHGEEEKI